MRARWYQQEDAVAWDALCESSYMSTILHTRAFMSHHGDRFVDRSVIVEGEGGHWLGVVPAAVSGSQGDTICSHPGLTYGGVVHNGGLRGTAMIDALVHAAALWRSVGYTALLYKAVPYIYHRAPAQDDLYALFRLGAKRTRCDLSACIDLACRLALSHRRRRSLRKAKQAGLRIQSGADLTKSLWPVLEDNLMRKHRKRPTHSADEIEQLAHQFPRSVEVKAALADAVVVAGVVLFHTPTTTHAQYIASSQAGQEMSALDAVFDRCIDEATARGSRWFDFGISNEEEGKVLNAGLHRYKTEFGAGGVAHEFYHWDLGGDQRGAQR
jgi:hypothetical protein